MSAPRPYTVYAVPCQHCRHQVVPDGRGYWVHTWGWAYACRNQYGVTTGTHAAPVMWPPRFSAQSDGYRELS